MQESIRPALATQEQGIDAIPSDLTEAFLATRRIFEYLSLALENHSLTNKDFSDFLGTIATKSPHVKKVLEGISRDLKEAELFSAEYFGAAVPKQILVDYIFPESPGTVTAVEHVLGATIITVSNPDVRTTLNGRDTKVSAVFYGNQWAPHLKVPYLAGRLIIVNESNVPPEMMSMIKNHECMHYVHYLLMRHIYKKYVDVDVTKVLFERATYLAADPVMDTDSMVENLVKVLDFGIYTEIGALLSEGIVTIEELETAIEYFVARDTDRIHSVVYHCGGKKDITADDLHARVRAYWKKYAADAIMVVRKAHSHAEALAYLSIVPLDRWAESQALLDKHG